MAGPAGSSAAGAPSGGGDGSAGASAGGSVGGSAGGSVGGSACDRGAGSGVAATATYYLDAATGDDLQAGTIEQPWRTLGKAASTLQAGEAVLLRAGTYPVTSTVHPAHSGTKEQPITFANYPGESALIDCGTTSTCFSLQGSTGITLQGLRMTTAATAVGASMVYMEASSDCSFIDCEFFGMPQEVGSENTAVIRCMGTENGFSRNGVVRNCFFHDNLSPALRLYDTDGWLIEHNEFQSCAQAIGGKDQPMNMTVRRNLIQDSGLAFYFAGQGGCRNVTITENLVINSQQGFQIGGLGTEGQKREQVSLHHNTFVNCSNFIVGWDDGFTTSQVYANNIFFDTVPRNIGAGSDVAGRLLNLDKYGSQTVKTSDYVMDYNLFAIPPSDTSIWFIDANLTASSLAEWQATLPPFEQHSLSAEPLFVDASQGDYHLKASSPGKGAGQNGEDMGAYPRGDDCTIIGRMP